MATLSKSLPRPTPNSSSRSTPVLPSSPSASRSWPSTLTGFAPAARSFASAASASTPAPASRVVTRGALPIVVAVSAPNGWMPSNFGSSSAVGARLPKPTVATRRKRSSPFASPPSGGSPARSARRAVSPHSKYAFAASPASTEASDCSSAVPPAGLGGSSEPPHPASATSTASAAALGRVLLASQEVERHVGIVADDPRVVPRRHVEEVARAHHALLAVVHPDGRGARHHQPDVLDRARRGAGRGADMLGPAPARLVRRPADGHRPDAVDLEAPLLELPHLGGIREVQEREVHAPFLHQTGPRYRM